MEVVRQDDNRIFLENKLNNEIKADKQPQFKDKLVNKMKKI